MGRIQTQRNQKSGKGGADQWCSDEGEGREGGGEQGDRWRGW